MVVQEVAALQTKVRQGKTEQSTLRVRDAQRNCKVTNPWTDLIIPLASSACGGLVGKLRERHRRHHCRDESRFNPALQSVLPAAIIKTTTMLWSVESRFTGSQSLNKSTVSA